MRQVTICPSQSGKNIVELHRRVRPRACVSYHLPSFLKLSLARSFPFSLSLSPPLFFLVFVASSLRPSRTVRTRLSVRADRALQHASAAERVGEPGRGRRHVWNTRPTCRPPYSASVPVRPARRARPAACAWLTLSRRSRATRRTRPREARCAAMRSDRARAHLQPPPCEAAPRAPGPARPHGACAERKTAENKQGSAGARAERRPARPLRGTAAHPATRPRGERGAGASGQRSACRTVIPVCRSARTVRNARSRERGRLLARPRIFPHSASGERAPGRRPVRTAATTNRRRDRER
jgi:hypothetical protein